LAELGSFCTFSLSGTRARVPVWSNWVRFAHFALRRPQAGRSRRKPVSNPRSAIEKLASFCTLDAGGARPFLSVWAKLALFVQIATFEPQMNAAKRRWEHPAVGVRPKSSIINHKSSIQRLPPFGFLDVSVIR
jgi:hypothetical protein